MTSLSVFKYVIIAIIMYKEVFAIRPCQTPDLRNGNCISLTDCQKYSTLYSSEYVRESHCGYKNSNFNVCCKTDLPISRTLKTPFVKSDLIPDKDTCGIQGENKIVGGEVTDLDEHPWLARLEYKNPETGYESSECGGTLISERYVLTAAHCIKPELTSVTLGAWNITNICFGNPDNCKGDCIYDNCAPLPLKIPIEKKIVFPSYDQNDLEAYHDIALLRLQKKIVFTEFVKPICLPTATDEIFNNYLNKNVTVAGWGRTEKHLPSSLKLEVALPVTKCKYEFLDAARICAGGQKGKDSCKGDSGGPLMIEQLDEEKDSAWYIIGVLSIGSSTCGIERKPAFYTKVAKYMYWIVENLEP